VSHDLVLVVNPTAGRGRAGRLAGAVTDRLGAGGDRVRVIAEQTAARTEDELRSALADGVDGVVVLGGDGLVHLALQQVAGTGTPLGIVPAGTGNDIAVALGISRDPLAAASLIASAKAGPVDAVYGDGRWWLSVLCAGFDSAINERANRIRWPRGPRRYDVAILAELAMLTARHFTVTVDGTPWTGPAILVAVGNTEQYGGGYRMCAGADPTDGLLDVVIIRPVGRLDLVRMLPKVKSARHLQHPAVTVLRGREVTVEAATVVAYADGERLGELPQTMRCEPAAVQIWAPDRAIG
jgi:diacylglycerol kinase (ATP)